MVAWSIWVAWQTAFNDDSGTGNARVRYLFGELTVGAGFAFAIIAMLLFLILTKLELSLYNADENKQYEVPHARRWCFPPCSSHPSRR
jgi:hypothetical protein